MRKENASFVTKFISEAGSYLNNADYFAFVELKDFACYVIADGIDSDDSKKSAELAVVAVISKFSDMPGISKGKLRKYVMEAHKALLDEAAEIRLEASILVLVTDYKNVRWAYAGNCRLCLIHNGAIHAVTKDTSLTQRMADNEEIPLDMIASHEERNNLYAYLGQPGKLNPIISSKRKIEDGDIIILQTRGAWENIGDAELLDATDGVSKAEDVCTGLEDVILSQRLEIIENYTIATIFIDKIYKNPKQGKNKKIITMLVGIITAILVTVITLLVAKYVSNRRNLNKLDEIKAVGLEKLDEEKYEAAMQKFNESEDITVSVKESSKDYARVQSVKLYNSLSENLYDAVTNINSQGYKSAIKDIERSMEIAEELNDLGEDVSDINAMLKSFRIFASSMQNGDAYVAEDNYADAIIEYKFASESVEKFDDTSYKQIAEEAISSAESNNQDAQINKNLDAGENAEAEGDELAKSGDYSNAIRKYETAQEFYKLASDAGSNSGASKLESIKIKIADANTSNENTSNEEKMEKAIAAESEAREAARNGEYDVAKEKYQIAKKLYEELGNAAKVSDVEDKIDEISGTENGDLAIEKMYTAMEYLSKGQFAKACKYLNEAKSIYAKLGDTARVKQIDTILDNIDELEKILGVG